VRYIPKSDKLLTFPPFGLSNFGYTRKDPISNASEQFSRNILLSAISVSVIFLINGILFWGICQYILTVTINNALRIN
jgi:hypothetical protein